MTNNKGTSRINLQKLAGGAFAEKLNEALLQVADNIQNPNTDAVAKREITIKIKFAPNKTRQLVNTTISVTTKLAATEAIDTQMLMGKDLKTGQLEIAEYNGQTPGQMSLFDEPEDDDEDLIDELAQPSTGKPLDLRERGKQRDPEQLPTGEQNEGDRGTTGGLFVSINHRAAEG